MNYQIVTKIIGRIMCVEAAFMLPALIISVVNGETESALGFIVAMLLLAAVGGPLSIRKQVTRHFYAREGFVTVGLTWIIVSLFGALPFYISGAIPGFVNCLFESISGFTTTGASVLADVEALPLGISYWRCFTNWLGGMGVLVFLLALGPVSKEAGYSMHLLRAESTGPRVGKLTPRIQSSAKILYKIYVVMTVAHAAALLMGGLPLFDSVAIALSTAGTGGFGIKNDSIASYGTYTHIVTTVFMLLFSLSFNVFYLIILREFKKALKSEELRAFLIIVALAAALIAANIAYQFESAGETLLHSVFQVVSIISTTGFATADFNLWPQFARSVLLILMLIGACAGSTGGGIKVVRVIIILKSVRCSILSVLRPNSVNLVHVDGALVEDDTVKMVYNYMMIYLILLAASTVLLSLDGFGFESGFTAVLSSLNNLGPGLGLVGPLGNYGMFSWASKLILCLDMLLGRLEMFPMIILFTPSAWRK